uniref:Uncharacterized protein n=1 Tax=Helicotheca tamesis TaxID=374047 RepID=A0A7S2H0S3_9STRA|mmetsp:Transcript_14119/g.19320  ORF Transcript_14119/g.19320 Transcript_14119/m.19320 type:complete len:198 (+) Transcript_14119:94-687(+)
MLRNSHPDNTQCRFAPIQRVGNGYESQRVQVSYDEDGVFDDTLLLTRSSSEHTSDKVGASKKVVESRERRIMDGHNLSEIVNAYKNRHAGVSQINERNENLSTQQRVQVRQNGSMDTSFPSPTGQTSPASVNAQLLHESCSDFLEMTRPKKNGNTRVSTEWHALKLGHCIARMLDRVDIDFDDLSDDEEEEYVDHRF